LRARIDGVSFGIEKQPALERYFKALESIAVSADGLSASDVADCCNLPVATDAALIAGAGR
jgi:hypothetical protein